MMLLQAAQSHADQLESSVTALKRKRLACGISDDDFDSVVERSGVAGPGVYRIPVCTQLQQPLVREPRIRQVEQPEKFKPDSR
jgi:hypothetical protein